MKARGYTAPPEGFAIALWKPSAHTQFFLEYPVSYPDSPFCPFVR